MKKIIGALTVIFLLLLSAYKSDAQNTEWTIVSSTVSFKIKNAGFNIDGKFGEVNGIIIFDASKNTGNSIDATIDAKTINTGNDMRDGHLKKKDYFDITTYPKINMKGNLFSKEKDGTFKGYFKLTLKNKTKEIIVPMSFIETGDKGQFKATFTIDRLDYGVGESSMILSDNATIAIEVNVIKK